MSSDFYFTKWKQTLVDLEAVVGLDVHFQETKAHDNKRCEASRRLSGVLARYMALYNGVWECLSQNLQLQKTTYIRNVLKAVASRILELKHELQKLEVSEYHFGSNGMVDYKLTHNDTELSEIPDTYERPKSLQSVLQDIFDQVKERKRLLEEEATKKKSLEEEKIINWWDDGAGDEDTKETVSVTDQKQLQLSEQQLKIKNTVQLIQAHEKTRQVIAKITQKRNKLVTWKKALEGTLAPPAPYEIRKKAADIIQQACRAFFDIKRQRVLQCKRNELLGLNPCFKSKLECKEKCEQTKRYRIHLREEYSEQWKIQYENKKQDFLTKRGDEIREHYRKHIRDWFQMWYEAILFFHDIPPEKRGGAIMIIRDELPTPEEWLEEYNTHLAEKAAKKGKTALDKKFATLEAKRKEMERKKAEHIKTRIEQELQRKIMKNPTLHPGFYFPKSKKTQDILEIIANYNKDWAELDAMETLDVKEKYVQSIDLSNMYMDAKIELVSSVQEDMRHELKLLKKALKKDYKNNGEKMPEQMKKTYKKEKKKMNINKNLSINIAEKLEELVFRGYVKEYPKIKIDEFFGDPNFVGDELRCNYVSAFPHNGEMRTVWWDKCRQLSHGFHRILLVGPRGSGKTTLVYVLASVNDAVLFELDPGSIDGLLENDAYLDYLVRSVASCAKVFQPSVIHIKHVNRLFYRKVPAQDVKVDWKLIQKYFVKKLFNHIHKTDKITIIGTCVDPWMSKSQQMLKRFPTAVLMPNTSHGTAAHILKDWVLRHAVIPANFDISCLAHVLKGYSYGYLHTALEKFLTADTIVKIAARGLSPMDVYDFIITDTNKGKIDYERYQKWYYAKTAWGVREKRHIQEQLEFKQALAEYNKKMEKRKKKSRANAPIHQN